MSTNDSNIQDILTELGNSIIEISKKNAKKAEIADRGLSGNKIHGGLITQFSSVGIVDESTQHTDKKIRVADDGVQITTELGVRTISNPLRVKGALTVEGAITATSLHVDEITADIRNERTSPLEFFGPNKDVGYGKGLVWPGGDYTKQFVLQPRPDRFFSSESIDLHREKEYFIQGQSVLSVSQLGNSVVNSSLRTLGTLESLSVDGNVTVDNYIYYEPGSQRLGFGTDAPNGIVSLKSWDHEFVIDETEDRKFKIGTWTTTALQIITDDTPRIEISHSGTVVVKQKLVANKLGVGVKNFEEDVDITTGGAVRFQNKKFEVAEAIPTVGNYRVGDIVWHANPKPSGHIGWVCVREGTPGQWKSFGTIST